MLYIFVYGDMVMRWDSIFPQYLRDLFQNVLELVVHTCSLSIAEITKSRASLAHITKNPVS